jgi:hypothetical protein
MNELQRLYLYACLSLKNYMTNKLLLLLLCGCCMACKPQDKQVIVDKKTETKEIAPTKPIIETPLDKTVLPIPKELKNVLLADFFHKDEVWSSMMTPTWYGLFQNKEGYYIAKTKISTNRFQDEVYGDEDGKKTGWQVKTDKKDTCIVLLSNINLPEGKVKTAEIDVKQLQLYEKNKHFPLNSFTILPSEKFNFDFNNIKYTLFATGEKTYHDDEWFTDKNYKVILKAENGDTTIEQLIVASPSCSEHEIRVLWLGDIDQDGKLDLILDVSTQENVLRVAVFLSSKATKNQIVKYFGECAQVGC